MADIQAKVGVQRMKGTWLINEFKKSSFYMSFFLPVPLILSSFLLIVTSSDFITFTWFFSKNKIFVVSFIKDNYDDLILVVFVRRVVRS